ncbi:glutathione S-transferase [Vibrio makurazakiensis]|uniref:glutathione S-transferase n=1 Tax=Vibrio makurazakiensis TaxID=2910250 RepID=UPI003D116A3C
MGLLLAKQPVILRDIVTRNKPPELLEASPKGTVPVLVFDDGRVIEQSLDVMHWALSRNDPSNLLRLVQPETSKQIQDLIAMNDREFIPNLEQYRASMRYRNDDQEQRRKLCETFIKPLEERLSSHAYFFGDTPSQADYALMPFISQFARVDKKWFVTPQYKNIERWLRAHYESSLYTKVMKQYPQWIETGEEFLFE